MKTTCPNCAPLLARAEAAEAELARMRSRPPTGRRPAAPIDEKTQLVTTVCAARGLTRVELADLLGISSTRLSPSGIFAAADHDRLMDELRLLARVKA